MSHLPDLPEHGRRAQLRISDADRGRAAEIIRQATGEGRLDLNEADARLRAIYAATTYAELDAINADLPGAARSLLGHHDGTPASGHAIAIMGGFKRRGAWIVPRRFTGFAFWGGGTIDLREAVLAGDTIRINAYAVMGGIEILLPENAEVHSNGVGVMGGFGHEAGGATGVDGPRIIVSGFAFWGGVDIRRAPTDAETKRRKAEQKRLKKQQKQIEG